ncbi:HAMP domain-containing sensor histidine kinase [uncultured Parabacteroides sp.]|uniref:PAS domain-containing sensor histidine kinase n=1 Tax=uncultured Parabacteroides sp. TaxID=512312 RepID=UPI002625C629|nr:HAMP domain-containing sensor histidine kinase [uncultured Parabacteroides sp.]
MNTTLSIEFEPFFSQISHHSKIGCAKYDLSTGEGVAMEQWYLNMGEVPGTPLDQIVGIYSKVQPEDRESMKVSLNRIVREETDHDQKEVRVKDGEGWKWIRQDTIEVGGEKSRQILLLMNYDISELKAMEKRMLEAEKLGRLKSAFWANISHEIRMPLNAIVGFSSLLEDEEDYEMRQNYIRIIQTNNELLLGIINEVLDLARIESDIMTFNFTEFDLKQLLEETVSSFQIKVSEGVTLGYPDSLDSFVFRSDRIRLKQILGNFITNAIKHTSMGRITVSYEVTEKEVLLSVIDTGEGIPEETMLHVFDRFYKGHNQKQGTGLGLAICQNIIEKLGGHIGVSSELGKGSRFWCTLPIFPRKDVN